MIHALDKTMYFGSTLHVRVKNDESPDIIKLVQRILLSKSDPGRRMLISVCMRVLWQMLKEP